MTAHTHDHETGARARQADAPDHHATEHAGHGDHARVFRDRFWVTLLLAVPVVVFSGMFQDLLGYQATFTGSFLIAPVLGSVVFFYGGWPFLTGAISELRARRPGMMLLIGMAITVAWGASLAASIGWFDVEVWWELALLIVIMLLGHWLEMRAVGQASGALEALAELLPDEAEIVAGENTRTVRLADLAVGDVVLVRSGGRVPADGTVVAGAAEMDESMITGESRPALRTEGSRVIAGTVATDSAVRVRVDAVGSDTALAGIQRLVAEAQTSRSRAQLLADKAAALLFYVAVAAAAITVLTWSLLDRPDDAVTLAVTVLIIACPHALGLAIPLVVAISTSMSARGGILVKDRLALERMRKVDVVLFDKTGTLTRGVHRLADLAVANPTTTGSLDDDQLLAVAAAVEADSEHPLARAIVSAARDRGMVPSASGFRSMTGRGVEAQVNGDTFAVGGPALLRERNLAVTGALADQVEGWSKRGSSILYVLRSGEIVGALALEDEVRPESRQAVDALHERGIKVALLTGDARQVAEAVAADLGIDEVFAEVLPADKDGVVAQLQRRGHTVAMVGDGVNDAPALARADVGIAIGAGTDVAIESAGIVLASSDPRGVVAIGRLSRASYRKMLQNLWWAAGYNIVAIPLAAGALAWAGLVMPMAVGAALMSLSTVVVAINAQLLRRTDLAAA